MEEHEIDDRLLKTTQGLSFKLKYIADSQKLSWYNKNEYPKNECDFCNLSAVKNGEIHSLIRTDVSLFTGHELLVSSQHAGDYIGLHLRHMLNIVSDMPNAVVAFEGSKNAPLKKYHFTCHHLKDKKLLPIVNEVNSHLFMEVILRGDFSIGILDVYGRNPIVLKSTSRNVIEDVFHELEKIIGVTYSTNTHPYINIIVWKEGDNYLLAAIPRVVYKPTEYYDENIEWDIALGVLEMAGLYLISNQGEFMNLKAEQLTKVADEVSYSNTHILEMLEHLKNSNI